MPTYTIERRYGDDSAERTTRSTDKVLRVGDDWNEPNDPDNWTVVSITPGEPFALVVVEPLGWLVKPGD